MNVLELHDVHKSFRRGFWGTRHRVLRGVSLVLGPGEVYGFLGHNGAGKSTTMKIALGLAGADRGTVRLFGEPGVTPQSRRRVGYLSEEIGMYPHLDAVENLRLVGELFRIPRRRLTARIGELLEAVGLADDRRLRVKHYSKGMRQRLGVAGALMNDPELLLLDEPYSGLDPVGRKDVRELLLALKARGKTIMLSSHIVPDVEAVCDRVGILAGGVVAREIDLGEVYNGAAGDVEVTLGGAGREGITASRYGGRKVFADDHVTIVRCPGDDRFQSLVNDVYAAQGTIVEVRRMRTNLEDVFVHEITREPDEAAGTDALAKKELITNR